MEAGKLADIVLWKPAFFGVKPRLMIKGGMMSAAPMGDPNASIPTPQPVHYRPMFGALGGARAATTMTFLRCRAGRRGARALGLEPASAFKDCRSISKADMVSTTICRKSGRPPDL